MDKKVLKSRCLIIWIASTILLQYQLRICPIDFPNYIEVINALLDLSLAVVTILSGLLGLTLAFDEIKFLKSFEVLKKKDTDLKFLTRLSSGIVLLLSFILLLIVALLVSDTSNSLFSMVLLTIIFIVLGILVYQCYQIFQIFILVLNIYIDKEKAKRHL